MLESTELAPLIYAKSSEVLVMVNPQKPNPSPQPQTSLHMRALAHLSPRQVAILEALFVTLLWSSSIILIKLQLQAIPALSFAGLRYTIAFVVLLPFGLRSGDLQALRTASRRTWAGLIALGLVFYTLTQGTQFLSLALLPAVILNFILSLSPVLVALIAMPLLSEWPNRRQWFGVVVVTAGVLLFFTPLDMVAGSLIGIAIAVLSLFSNASATILGRAANRSRQISALAVTIVSMGIGGIVLLAAGLLSEGLPRLSWGSWAVVLWLALVNTALVFPLWNHSLRLLSAVESSVIQTSMAVQVPILAWIFLGESMTPKQVLGLAVALAGILLVQLARRRSGG